MHNIIKSDFDFKLEENENVWYQGLADDHNKRYMFKKTTTPGSRIH